MHHSCTGFWNPTHLKIRLALEENLLYFERHSHPRPHGAQLRKPFPAHALQGTACRQFSNDAATGTLICYTVSSQTFTALPGSGLLASAAMTGTLEVLLKQ